MALTNVIMKSLKMMKTCHISRILHGSQTNAVMSFRVGMVVSVCDAFRTFESESC